jgi:hypothetical protein
MKDGGEARWTVEQWRQMLQSLDILCNKIIAYYLYRVTFCFIIHSFVRHSYVNTIA